MELIIENISKRYGDDDYIIKQFSGIFLINEKIAIVGANGSGKTTLLRMLSSLVIPSSGQIRFNNFHYDQDIKSIKKIIGWMPSNDSGMFAKLTGRENLYYFATFYKLRMKDVENFLSEWSDFSLISKALSTPYYLCSNGMKRALLLVKSMLHNPLFLILDEPFNGLDLENKNFFISILQEKTAKKLLCFSSHQQEDVQSLSTRTLHIKDGYIV